MQHPRQQGNASNGDDRHDDERQQQLRHHPFIPVQAQFHPVGQHALHGEKADVKEQKGDGIDDEETIAERVENSGESRQLFRGNGFRIIPFFDEPDGKLEQDKRDEGKEDGKTAIADRGVSVGDAGGIQQDDKFAGEGRRDGQPDNQADSGPNADAYPGLFGTGNLRTERVQGRQCQAEHGPVEAKQERSVKEVQERGLRDRREPEGNRGAHHQ